MGPIRSSDSPAGTLSDPSNGKEPRLVRDETLESYPASAYEVPLFASFGGIASSS